MARRQGDRARLRRRLLGTTGLALATVIAAGPASAREAGRDGAGPVPVAFEIAEQDLDRAVLDFAKRTGVRVFYDAAKLGGKRTPGVTGTLTPEEALSVILADSGLAGRWTSTASVRIGRVGEPETTGQITGGQASATLEEITVEGAGAPGASASPGAARAAGQPPPTGTVGQPPPPYSGGQVGTGGRVGLLGNRSVFDTPFSVTNLTSKYIQDTQASSLGDAVAADPSIRNHAPRGTHYDQFIIRGFPVFNSDVLFDGLYGIIPDQAYTAEFAERVEIFKGPNAFLNGLSLSGTIGGAINVVPKRAYDIPLTRITASYATNLLGGTHVDWGRRFGQDNAFGLRLNGVYRNGDSVVRDQGHEVGAFTAAADYRGDRFRMTADIGYQNQRDERTFSFVNVAPESPVPRAPNGSFNFAPPWTYIDTRNVYGLTRAEYDLAPNVTAFAAVGGNAANYRALNFSPTVFNAAGDFTTFPNYFVVDGRTISSEAGVRSLFETGPINHRLTLAGTYVDQVSRIPGFYPLVAANGNLYTPYTGARPFVGGVNLGSASATQLSSVAISDTLSSLDDRVQLTVGVRQQWIAGQSFTLAGAQTADYNEGKPTPSAGLVVKPLQNLSVYGNYIETFTRGPTAPATASNAGEIFPPIVSTSKEVGAKYDFGTLGMALAFFEITQPQFILTPTSALPRFGLDGLQRNRGIEYTIFGEVAPGVRTLGGVTLLDGRLVRSAGGVNDGKVAIGAPDVSLTLGIDADVPQIPGLALLGRVLYTSSQFLTADNTKAIPDWTRIDLGLRYAFAIEDTPMILRFNVENVADEAYWASSARGFLSRGIPRTFLLSLTVDL